MRGSFVKAFCSRAMASSSSSPSSAASAAGVAASLNADDWGLSMEEMDRLERNAVQQVAARRIAPSSQQKKLVLSVSQQSGGNIGFKSAYDKNLIAAYKTVGGLWDPNLRIWTFPEHRFVDVVRAVTRIPGANIDLQPVAPLSLPNEAIQFFHSTPPPASLTPISTPDKSQERPSPSTTPQKPVLVRIAPSDSDHIFARTPYDKKVIEACRSVQGSWNGESRAWTFPRCSIDDLVKALQQFPHVKLEVDPSLESTSSQTYSSPALGRNEDFNVADQSRRLQVGMFLHHNGLVALRSPASNALIEAIKTIPRSYWSPTERVWVFPASSIAEAEKTLGSMRNVQLETFVPLVRRALKHLAEQQDLTEKYQRIPEDLESSLLPFQRDGVRFVLQHGGKVLIADEMGLGKTVQAIAVAACFREDWPVLVIVPSSLRFQWAAMLKSWLGISPSDITIVVSQGASSREGFTIVNSAGKSLLELHGLFNIISYDMVGKLQDKDAFKIVIADESHYMKNSQAKRTIACVPVVQNARYAVLLTGTPALSRPIELYKQLEALQPGVYYDMHEYGQRYCSGSMFGLYQGSSNREELHSLLKSTVMIRRLKCDVLNELPPKFRQQVFLSLDVKSTKDLRVLFAQLKLLRGNQVTDENVERLKNEEKQLIVKIYSASAVAKLPAVLEYLSTIMESDCKLLVFAHHQTMLDGIECHVKKCKMGYIRIDGGTPAVQRPGLVTSFQENDAVKVAVLSIRAAGVGLTLTAASVVIFAEMSWTPGDMVQAEDRAHRLGQHSSVNIYYLHAQDTIDDLIWESVRSKLGSLGEVLNGRKERLHLTPSPRQQVKISTFMRPCARNLSEDYETSSSKRCKLSFD